MLTGKGRLSSTYSAWDFLLFLRVLATRWIRTILMLVMQCLTSPAMDLSAACDLPPCHLSGLLFGHVRCFPVLHIFCSLHCICVIFACLFFLDFLWSGILIFVFSFGAWWKIRSVLKISRTGSKGNISLNRSKRRLLNLAVQTSACLLLNMVRQSLVKPNDIIPMMIPSYTLLNMQTVTILTLTALEDWSTTTDIWLACEITETFFTR